MHEVITALLTGRGGVHVAAWHGLWDRLDDGALDRAEVAALLGTLATRLPERDTLRALVASLRERRPSPGAVWPGTVNIVGTGGGPRTFNISTAAAFTAAAMGVRVVKSGSRAYTGSVGSVDLLERLGVRLTRSPAETETALAEHGVAFVGPHVYPAQLTRMARLLVPLGLRPFGRFLNALGPFLADVPVSAQVTGVSAAAPLAELCGLAAAEPARRIWLCANAAGSDELLPFADNTIYRNDGVELTRHPTVIGSLADLAESETLIEHFRAVLSGSGNPVATEAVCLNAAALAVAGDTEPHWELALAKARATIAEGAVVDLLDRMGARVMAHG